MLSKRELKGSSISCLGDFKTQGEQLTEPLALILARHPCSFARAHCFLSIICFRRK